MAGPIVLFLSVDQFPEASQQLLQGAEDRLGKASVRLVNIDAYPSILQAWRAVQQLKPDGVIGPLDKDNVAMLASLQPKVPVIALNQGGSITANIWQLSFPAENPVYALATTLAKKGIDHVAVLVHRSDRTDRLYQAFIDVWSLPLVDKLAYQESKHVRQASQMLLHTKNAQQRIQQISGLLQSSVTAVPWVRQDLEALVVFAPLEDALTLSYQIDYLWGQDIALYWIDTGSDALSAYIKTRTNWGRMQTWMPNYQVAAMQSGVSNLSFFRAIGQDAAQLMQLRLAQGVWPENALIEGNLGQYHLENQSYLQVTLPLVWLGDGQVDRVE